MTEGLILAALFVIIVVGLALYSRHRYRQLDALEQKAATENPSDPEISQSFAAKLDQQARDKGAV